MLKLDVRKNYFVWMPSVKSPSASAKTYNTKLDCMRKLTARTSLVLDASALYEKTYSQD